MRKNGLEWALFERSCRTLAPADYFRIKVKDAPVIIGLAYSLGLSVKSHNQIQKTDNTY